MEGDTRDQLRTQPRQAREIDAKRFRQARANSATANMRSLQSQLLGDLSATRKVAPNGLWEVSVPTPAGTAARRLAADGQRIRAMSPSTSSDRNVRAVGAEPARCNLDTVIAAECPRRRDGDHCAAFVEQWGPPDAWIASTCRAPGVRSELTNVGTTPGFSLCQAAARRFIHIGT